MPALTAEQARKYYDSLPATQKPKGDPANAQWLLNWFTNAVNAGVPDAIRAAGGREGGFEDAGSEKWEEAGGASMDWKDAADPSEWMGKRKPTPRELRKWAHDQHNRYIGGDKSAQDEDYERFSDRVLADLIKKTWDVSGGGWKPGGGNPWRSYDDQGNMVTDVGGGPPGSYREGAGGGPGAPGGGAAAKPAEPVTYTEGDEALTYTGNPLVDNMLQMFNRAQSQRATVEGGGNVDRADLGHFARGEDAQVGGGDDLSKIAGMLMGTGNNAFLWTAVDDEAFGGLKGQHKGEAAKARPGRAPRAPSPAAIANPDPPPVEQTAQEIVEPAGPRIPSYKQDQIDSGFDYKQEYFGESGSPLSKMMGRQFGKKTFAN
jgi:hypothetical protein